MNETEGGKRAGQLEARRCRAEFAEGDGIRGPALELAGDSPDALAASDCNVKDYIFYSLVEEQKNPSNIEDWLGLYNADGTPTETLNALAGSASRWAYVGAKARTASTPQMLALCHR